MGTLKFSPGVLEMVRVGSGLMEPGGALGANQLPLFFENGKLENRVARGRFAPSSDPVFMLCHSAGVARVQRQMAGPVADATDGRLA